jgi:hypothetical protein
MKRIVVKLTGMPFDPTYEIDDDTIAVGDLVPGAGQRLLVHRGRRDRDRHRPGKLLHRPMQARHQSHVSTRGGGEFRPSQR